jgi:demethylmenaquinone methyltransferase/2-methoxy-6-polyprenyl-1,4-benzoquinol methylase
MANKYLDSNVQRAARVNELFGSIARRYDLINDLQSFGLHRFWKRRILKLASVQPGDRALDVCCGTGDIALALARSGAEVVGVDFSKPMLDIAELRTSKFQNAKLTISAQAPQLPHSELRIPRFICADAQQLPFPNNFFDIVTVGYGLRNLADWQVGLREMCRVAKPGGRLLVLDFGKPDNALWRSFYFGYLKLFVPLLGRIFCGNASAYAYILESLKNYPAQHGVAAAMIELGLANVQIINLLGGAMSINYGEKRRSS